MSCCLSLVCCLLDVTLKMPFHFLLLCGRFFFFAINFNKHCSYSCSRILSLVLIAVANWKVLFLSVLFTSCQMAGLLFLAVSSKNSFSLHFCEFVKFSLALLELMQLQCFQVFYCLFVSDRKNQKYCVYVCGSESKSALHELVPAWHRFVFNRCVSSFAVCYLRVVACP